MTYVRRLLEKEAGYLRKQIKELGINVRVDPVSPMAVRLSADITYHYLIVTFESESDMNFYKITNSSHTSGIFDLEYKTKEKYIHLKL